MMMTAVIVVVVSKRCACVYGSTGFDWLHHTLRAIHYLLLLLLLLQPLIIDNWYQFCYCH